MPYRFSRSRASRGTNISFKDSITHRPQGGGPKKQGLLPVVGTGQFSLWNGMRRAGSTPKQRNMVFSMNQIGGIGAVGSGNRSRMFAATANGARKIITPCLSPNVASALTILENYAATKGENLCLAGVSETVHNDILSSVTTGGFNKLSSEDASLSQEVRNAVKTINDLKLTFPVSSPTDIQIHVVALIDNTGADELNFNSFGIKTLCNRIIAYGQNNNCRVLTLPNGLELSSVAQSSLSNKLVFTIKITNTCVFSGRYDCGAGGATGQTNFPYTPHTITLICNKSIFEPIMTASSVKISLTDPFSTTSSEWKNLALPGEWGAFLSNTTGTININFIKQPQGSDPKSCKQCDVPNNSYTEFYIGIDGLNLKSGSYKFSLQNINDEGSGCSSPKFITYSVT